MLHFAVDGAAVLSAFYLAFLVRFRWEWFTDFFPIKGIEPPWSLYQPLLYTVVPLWIMIFWYSCRLYKDPWMPSTDRFLQIVKGCLLGAGATLLSSYIYERLQYSRLMLLLAQPIAVVLITFSQAIVLWFDEFMSRHEDASSVLLVGGDVVAGVVKERIGKRHPGAEIHHHMELLPPVELETWLENNPVIELILLKSSLPHKRILAAAEVCDVRGVAFKMLPDLLELRLGEVQMDHSLGLPAYRIQHTSMTRLNFAAKRTFDILFSGLVLILTAIPFALLCVLIRLDSKGAALYRQKRFGFRGRTFEALKFRTMVDDAETRITDVRGEKDPEGSFFKAKKDPRVTRVGFWLRRFSLDEFPQFINVLRGEMSTVGPRPLALTTGELERLEKEFGQTAKKRMNILPGITGLWQVSGRSDVSSEQRFALDLFYIEHWSLGLDLEIILKTAPAMLFGKGAY